MKLDGEDIEQQSYCGSILTILLFTISLMFLFTKIMTIVYKYDVSIMSSLAEGAIKFD